MNFVENLEKINASYQKRKPFFTKEEIRRIAGKDTPEGRMVDLFSFKYAKRTSLIQAAEILYGYVAKSYGEEGNEAQSHYPTWVFFSPAKNVNENPLLLKEAAKSFASFAQGEPKDAKERKIQRFWKENWTELDYFELPKTHTRGTLIYLSVAYFKTSAIENFHLGLNLILANRGVSKEILYLPEEYWSKDWAEYYKNPEF